MSARTVPLGVASGRTLFRVSRGRAVSRSVLAVDDAEPVFGPYFILERAVVDGTLPPPSEQGPAEGWIAPYHWDFLVYLNSSAKSRTGSSYASWRAANAFCGMNSLDVGPGVRARQMARKRDLLPVLQAAGFIRPDGSTAGGNARYQLMLAPAWTRPRGLVDSDVVRTIRSLMDSRRPYVMLPNQMMLDRTWRDLREHALRRMLVALYCFNDLGAWGGVDMNHLRIRDERLELSAAFLAASYADGNTAARLLHELFYLGLVQLVRTSAESVRAYPAARSQIIASSDFTGEIIRFVPTLQPAAGEAR